LPPSERIALAFIGPGGRGCNLIKAFGLRREVEILAVCDVRLERRERALALAEQLAAQKNGGGRYRACRPYRDFRDVLALPEVDGVVLAACEHWRPTMCVMAAKAGKDVYTEKPLALTAGEAIAMARAIRRYGRIFQHGTQRRCEEYVRTACEIVRSGRIGKVTHAVVPVGPGPRPAAPQGPPAPAPDPEVFDWDMWLGPAPWRPFGTLAGYWQHDADFGLRSIGNWGAHTLDMVQWALDKDEQTPVEIVPPCSSEEALALKYDDGLTIFCPRTPGDTIDASVFGTEGQKIIFGKPRIEERYDPTPLGPNDVRLYRAEKDPAFPRQWDDYYGNWLQCMRTRKKTICNEEVAYRSGMLCVLIAMADRLKRPFRYDPEKIQCPDDDEANRLLNTAKRAPWRATL